MSSVKDSTQDWAWRSGLMLVWAHTHTHTGPHLPLSAGRWRAQPVAAPVHPALLACRLWWPHTVADLKHTKEVKTNAFMSGIVYFSYISCFRFMAYCEELRNHVKKFEYRARHITSWNASKAHPLVISNIGDILTLKTLLITHSHCECCLCEGLF